MTSPYRAQESGAGGFTRNDGTVAFYQRVQALLEGATVVVDLGAGRGKAVEDRVAYRRRLQDLRGAGREVVGVDIDPAVMGNPLVDRAVTITGNHLPFDAGSVDVLVSDTVLEHVDEPEGLAAEIDRVLAPGGWFCARTPNRNGYIALGARVLPRRIHSTVLRVLMPHRKAEDIFPTWYRMNTTRDLERLFPAPRFRHCSYGHYVDPSYFGRSAALYRLVAGLSRVGPEATAPMLMVFVQKALSAGPRGEAGAAPVR